MSWMILKVLVSLCLAFAGETLTVNQMWVEKIGDHPSCQLLKHRALQRARVIEELRLLMEQTQGPVEAQILEQNSLITNKLFLDEATWRDEAAQVSLEVSVTPELSAWLQSPEAGKVLFKIKGPGLNWYSSLEQLPLELEFNYDPQSQLLRLKYPIYLHHLCESPEQWVELMWAGPEGLLEY